MPANGDASAWPVASAIRHFRKDFEELIQKQEKVKDVNYLGEAVMA